MKKQTKTSAPPVFFWMRIIHIVAHNNNSLNSILLYKFPFVFYTYILTGSLQFTILTSHAINSVVSLYETMCICSVYMEFLSWNRALLHQKRKVFTLLCTYLRIQV